MFLENFVINLFGFIICLPVIALLLNWAMEQLHEMLLLTGTDWLYMLAFLGLVAVYTLIN